MASQLRQPSGGVEMTLDFLYFLAYEIVTKRHEIWIVALRLESHEYIIFRVLIKHCGPNKGNDNVWEMAA